MRTLVTIFAVLFSVLPICCTVAAQQTNQPSVALGQAVSVTATVVAIDRADREVTLMGPQGSIVTIDIDDSVRNFDQIQAGDKVNITYYEAVAISIGPKGQAPSVSTATIVGRGPRGAKPEGYAVETTDAVAVVKSINRQKRTVTLRGPSGDVFTVNVPQDVRAFDQLKVGDSVHVRYTEAVAISVQKP